MASSFTACDSQAQKGTQTQSNSHITFSHNGGVLIDGDSVSVTIEPDNATGQIHFTTNGEPPTTKEKSSNRPISIRKSTTLRAAITSDEKIVDQDSRVFVFVEPETAKFSSDLPIVIVEAHNKDIDDEAYGDSQSPRRPVDVLIIDKNAKSGRTQILGPPSFIGRAGMRVRGQTSAHFAKKQYSVELWDEDNNDRDASLLGMPAESDWILHAPYADKSLMRNALAYQWAREMGQWAARTVFVELFHNADGDSISMDDYRGVYLLMEKIKRDDNRLKLSQLDDSISAEPAITGGYIFKNDKGTRNDVNFTGRMHRFGFVEPKEPNRAQRNYLREQVAALEQSLASNDFADPETGYRSHIDVRSFIDGHIHVELCKNVDGFRYSAYLHKDRNGKIRLGPVWDYNLSLGNAFSHEGDSPEGWYYDTIDADEYLWFARLFEDASFEIQYWDRYYELRKTVFATEKLQKQINEMAARLKESQARNFARWPIFDRELFRNPNIVMSRKSHEGQVAWLIRFVTERVAWMDKQFTPPPSFERLETTVQLAIPAGVKNEDMEIVYTDDGSDPRDDDGNRSEAAQTFVPNSSLPQSVTIKARLFDGTSWGALAMVESVAN